MKNITIKEELKFLGLGDSNRLNWNLISEEDKHKGEVIWKKIINRKKDIGINCNIKEENNVDNLDNINNINNLNKINKIIKPNLDIKKHIKNIVFHPEEKKLPKKERKTIAIKPKIKLDAIKINNNPSSIKSNNIFKINTKFIFNENIYNNEKTSDKIIPKQKHYYNIKKQKSPLSKMNYKYKILNKIKPKKRISNYKRLKLKKIKRKKSEQESSDSDLDIISEEIKSFNINNNEQEELYEDDYEEGDNMKDIDNNNKISLMPTSPMSFSISEINKINEENNIIEENEENKEAIEKEENIKKNENEEKEDNIDNIEEEAKDNEDENKTKEKVIKYRKIDKKSEKQDISIFQVDEFNQKLLLKKLKYKRKKTKKIRPSIYNFIEDLRKKNKSTHKEESPERKQHIRKYFKNVDTNSLHEINKRKLEILFRIKHDLEFKIRKGYIKSIEKLEFKDFEKKINSTKIQTLDRKGLDEYLDKLEEFFDSFENDMTNAENMKKDEERINGFRKNLIQNMDYAEIIRGRRERIFGNVIDFNIINHINELSVLDTDNKNININFDSK